MSPAPAPAAAPTRGPGTTGRPWEKAGPKGTRARRQRVMVPAVAGLCLYLLTYLLPTGLCPHQGDGLAPWTAGVPVARAASGEGVTLRLSTNSIGRDETVTLEMSVTTSGHGRPDSMQSPDLSDFQVLRQSNSQQISIINFNVSKTETYTYVLRPKRTGTIEIGPATVKAGGQTLSSGVVRLLVRDDQGTDPPGTGSGAHPAPHDWQAPGGTPSGQAGPPHGAGDQPGDTQTHPDLGGEDVVLLAETSTARAYVGQAVILNYNLATLIDLTEYRAEDPVLDGFWVETVPRQGQRPVFRQRNLSRWNYHVGEISQHVLYPLHPGTLTVPGVSFQVAYTTDLFGFGRQRLTGKSNPVTVEVLPLPTEDAPASFTGAVGRFTIGGHLKAGGPSTTTYTPPGAHPAGERGQPLLTAGHPVTYTIVISGNGNFRQFKAPGLPSLKGFRIHEPTVNDSLTATGQGLSGTRTIEYIMVPEGEGEFTIPPVQFSFFDPAPEAWRTVQTKPLRGEIKEDRGRPGEAAGGQAGGGGGAVDGGRGEVTGTGGEGDAPGEEAPGVWNGAAGGLGNTVPGWINQDGEPYRVQPIKLRTTLEHLRKPGTPPYTRWPFWALIGGLPLLWLFLIMTDAMREHQTKNKDRIRMRKAYARAKRRLREAEDHIHDSQPAGFFQEISRALLDYLQDKLGLQVGGMTTSSLRISMEARGYPGAVVDTLIEELENCDYARFAPGSGTPDEMNSSLNRSREILDLLEQSHPAKPPEPGSQRDRKKGRRNPGQGGGTSATAGLLSLLVGVIQVGLLLFCPMGRAQATTHTPVPAHPHAPATATAGTGTGTGQQGGTSLQGYFERGNERYYRGDYPGAIGDYTRIERYGVRDGTLLYNLGNAWLMSGRPGKAIYYYDRALWLTPRASHIRHNLKTAEAMAGRQQQIKTETPDGSGSGMVSGEASWLLWLKPLRFFTPAEMTVAFVILYVLLFIVLLYRRRSREDSSARPILSGMGIFLALVIALSGLYMAGGHLFRYHLNMGVITAPVEAVVLEGPTSAARLVSRVGEGSRVLIIDRAPGGWLKIRAGAHTEGWVQSRQLHEL